MSFINTIAITSSIAACSTVALAGLPNAHTWPMEHIMISMNGTSIEAHVNTSSSSPILLERFAGESYDGNASALDDMYYSDQYGWILDGIVDPGAGNSLWIELVSQTNGLETYEGSRRMMIGDQTFDPIFGTDSSAMNWQWSGMMTHNWYAVQNAGDYEATYSIYVGDSAGNAVDGYSAGEVTLNFLAVPAPGSLAILSMGTVFASRRKRA